MWRWLREDAIRPWHHRSWRFPRDPDFEEKAARILDRYAGLWRGLLVRIWGGLREGNDPGLLDDQRLKRPDRVPGH